MVIFLSLLLIFFTTHLGHCAYDSCTKSLNEFCITSEFPHAAAHGIHSMTLKELRYFFDKSATENNIIPIVNFNLSSPYLLLPSVPDLELNNSFSTPMMESVDHILSNWENDNFFMKGASVLEKLVHNMHMYETLSASGKIYKQIKRKKFMRKNIKKLCKCMKKDDDKVLENLGEMATFFRQEDGKASWRRKDYKWQMQIMRKKNSRCNSYVHSFTPRHILPSMGTNTEVPSLVNSTVWNIWKPQMTVAMEVQWNYELAYYLYCKLNHN